MRLAVFISLLLLQGLTVFRTAGQEHPAFSLNRMLPANAFSLDADSLFSLAAQTEPEEPKAAIDFYESLLHEPGAGQNELLSARIYEKLAALFNEIADYNRSVFYLQKAIASYRMHNRPGDYLPLSVLLAERYISQGNFSGIKEQYALIYHSLDRADLRFRMHHAVGRACYEMAQYDSATAYFFKTIRQIVFPDTFNYRYLRDAYAGLWNIHFLMELPDKATGYYRMALLISRHFNDGERIASLNHWGKYYLQKQDYARARRYTLEALELARRTGQRSLVLSHATTLAIACLKLDLTEEAMRYSLEAQQHAVTFSEKINASNLVANSRIRLGRYRAAEADLLASLKLAQHQQMYNTLSNIYILLSDVCAHTGRPEEALLFAREAGHIKDSLRGKENAAQVAQIELRYRNTEKDRALAQQQLLIREKESKIREQRIWMSSGAAASLLLIILLAGRYHHRQKLQLKQKQISYLNARMQGEELERGRIAKELHDGVGVLLSAVKMHYSSLGREFRDITGSDNYREIAHLLNKTGYELRSISYNLVPEMLIRESLPAAVQGFCDLIQKGHSIEIGFQSYGDGRKIPPDIAHHVYRIIQELIQNILKHAESAQAIVQLIIMEQEVHLTVEDSGRGFDNPIPKNGMGLANIRSRVGALNGRFSIHSRTGLGTTVEIEIPLSKS